MTGFKIVWCAAAWAAMLGMSAQAASPRACLTETDVANVSLVILPEAMQAVGTTCATALPPGATIFQPNGTMLQKYHAEAERALPAAKMALEKLGGPHGEISHELTMIVVDKIIKTIKPQDCALVNRIATSLEPLPPRNLADILSVVVHQLSDDDVRKGLKSSIVVCPQP